MRSVHFSVCLLIIFCLGLERSDSVRMRPGSSFTDRPPRVQAWEEWQKIEEKELNFPEYFKEWKKRNESKDVKKSKENKESKESKESKEGKDNHSIPQRPSVHLPGDDNHPRVRWGKWKKRTGKNLSFKKWKKMEEKKKRIREENKRRKKGLKRRGSKGKVEGQ